MVNLIWKSPYKSCEDSHASFNFYEFWSFYEIIQKNKTLIFDCYNLIDPKEWAAVTF
jgi:hypothetical protein